MVGLLHIIEDGVWGTKEAPLAEVGQLLEGPSASVAGPVGEGSSWFLVSAGPLVRKKGNVACCTAGGQACGCGRYRVARGSAFRDERALAKKFHGV